VIVRARARPLTYRTSLSSFGAITLEVDFAIDAHTEEERRTVAELTRACLLGIPLEIVTADEPSTEPEKPSAGERQFEPMSKATTKKAPKAAQKKKGFVTVASFKKAQPLLMMPGSTLVEIPPVEIPQPTPQPCPFCGSEAKIEGFSDNTQFSVFCSLSACDTCGPTRSSPGSAIASWNTMRRSVKEVIKPLPEIKKIPPHIAVEPGVRDVIDDNARLIAEVNKQLATIDELRAIVKAMQHREFEAKQAEQLLRDYRRALMTENSLLREQLKGLKDWRAKESAADKKVADHDRKFDL